MFVGWPDENPVDWVTSGQVRPYRVLELGCFHYLPPRRRLAYVELVLRALKPGGAYGLVTLGPEGGSGLSDREVYERRTLGGGLSYREEDLRAPWSGRLDVDEVRPMRRQPAEAKAFGEDFLLVLRASKPMTKPASDARNITRRR